MKKNFIFLLFVLPVFLFAQQKGRIAGKIFDERTLQPLVGVNIIIQGTQIGAATDQDGFFVLPNLQPGSYNLDLMYLGYETLKKNNVVVNPGRTTVVEFEMHESVLETEAIEVEGSYFEKPKDAVVSTRSMNFEEIRRSPGDILDIQRAVQAFPAVVTGSDQLNEIIIRGGIPGENLFIMDNIEIPNPNHFAVQGAGGGPINMLNSYMVRDLDFYAGAFPAKYGDKASSVMEIKNRDGSREYFRGEGSLGFAGVGGLVEGPIGDNASYIFSARKSYLDLIISSTGLTAVPQYYNFQGKLTWDINRNNKLSFNAVYGADEINIEDADEGGLGRGAENVFTENSQYILGATLRSFWANNIYSFTTISAIQNDFYADVFEKNDADQETTIFTNESVEAEYQVKTDFVWQLDKRFEVGFGASYKNISLNYNVWDDPDTLILYDVPGGNPIDTVDIFPEWRIDEDITSYKTATYFSLSWDMFKRLRLNAGLRYDYSAYNSFESISPRLGLSWTMLPRFTVNLAYGKHYQTPSYVELAANKANRNLDNKFTDQYVVGFDWLLRDDIRLTVEGFYKKYDDVPIKKIFTTPVSDIFEFDDQTYLNAGEGEAKGIEFFFQKKLTRSFSTILSYSLSKSTAIDARTGEEYNWDYDYRNVFTYIAGYKFFWQEKDWFQEFKKTDVYKYLSWFPLMPADQDEISFKWRYLGGRPYTPPVYRPQYREWVVEEQQQINPVRYPAYHRLDIRLDKRYIFDSWNLVVFFDWLNVYNRDNIWSYNYNDDGTRERVLQYKTLPVGGISVEF